MPLLVVSLVLAGAAPPPEGLTLEGQTGLLTVPSARTLREGSATLLYSPRAVPGFDDGTGDTRSQTFVAAVGLFSFAEVSGRVTEVGVRQGPVRLRDLSLNLKLAAPFSRVHRLLPDVAFGAQDEGGAATHFRTRYLVLTQEVHAVRATVGYGTGPNRMRGLFGGLEAALHETTSLIVEHDGERARAGARLALPMTVADVPFRLGAVGAVPLERRSLEGFGHWELGVTLEADLSLETRTSSRSAVVDKPPAQGLAALSDALVAEGFENVRVGTIGARTLVVEYENAVFNHAERDGVAAVRARIGRHTQGEAWERLVLRVLHHGVAVVALEGPPSALRARAVPPAMEGVTWLDARARNRTPLHARLTLAPGLRTFLATEAGLLEAVVSVRPELTVPLWRGGTVHVLGDVPLGWTRSFREGGALAAYRGSARVEDAMVLQGGRLVEGVLAQVGAGLFRRHHVGFTGELWASPRWPGTHQLGVQGAVFRTLFDPAESTRFSVTASWRAWSGSGTTFAGVRAGRFLAGDLGATAEVGRAFGDTFFSLFVTHTDRTLVGAALILPLTPRRDLRPAPFQVRGASRWRYSQESVVGSTRNSVGGAARGMVPTSTYTLEEHWLDGGRATVGAAVAPARVAEPKSLW